MDQPSVKNENRREAIIWAGFVLLAFACVFGWKYGRDHLASSRGKSVVADLLIDPSSAQFRNVNVVQWGGGAVVCGEINGKNRFGAYTGFQRFWATEDHAMIQPSPGASELEVLSWSVFADSCKE